ncbi:TPA: hypothetical protein ACGB1J_001314 [Serratia marcescens]|nr:hypothetical protein [Serratia marcescens]
MSFLIKPCSKIFGNSTFYFFCIPIMSFSGAKRQLQSTASVMKASEKSAIIYIAGFFFFCTDPGKGNPWMSLQVIRGKGRGAGPRRHQDFGNS